MFRDSIAPAYSLTDLPALGRITLYLVIRGLRYSAGSQFYSKLHKRLILGIPIGEGDKTVGISVMPIIGIKVLSLHHDMITVIGERSCCLPWPSSHRPV
jgi:hypothetical protein